MRKFKWLIGGAMIVAVIAVAGFFALDEQTRRAITGSMGSTTTGGILCAKVGALRADVVACLEPLGYGEVDQARGGDRQFERFEEGREIVILYDPSWRRSTISLQIEEDGAVSRIEWYFDPLAP